MRYRKTKSALSFCLATVLAVIALMVPAMASATIMDWYLVDSGKHLDYDGNSQYMSYVDRAANLWNGYKPGVIRKDSISVIQDVFIGDIDQFTEFAGITYGNGTILLNAYYLKNYSDGHRLQTAAHELGHALGLGDTQWPADIMCGVRQSFPITILSRNDEESYDASYARYK